jgi:hypothetical protein
MVHKQMKVMGVPGFDESVPENAIRIYSVTTDGGSDQIKCRRITKVKVMPLPRTLYFECNCMMHNIHLDYKGGLKIIDVWLSKSRPLLKYYGSVCKLTILWRETCRSVFVTWRRLFGSEAAVQHALHLVPRCVAGRWGSLSSVEARPEIASYYRRATGDVGWGDFLAFGPAGCSVARRCSLPFP